MRGDVDEAMPELQTGTPETTSLRRNCLQMRVDLGKVIWRKEIPGHAVQLVAPI